jgi:hypothetical protein
MNSTRPTLRGIPLIAFRSAGAEKNACEKVEDRHQGKRPFRSLGAVINVARKHIPVKKRLPGPEFL